MGSNSYKTSAPSYVDTAGSGNNRDNTTRPAQNTRDVIVITHTSGSKDLDIYQCAP
jgi:hypothetical protein